MPPPGLGRDACGNKTRLGKSAEISRGGPGLSLAGAIAAVILYRQFPSRSSPDSDRRRPSREYVKGLPPVETIRYFHLRILPGIDIF